MSHLDRRHYRLLIALSRHGSVSAAANALYITQSAASQQLREAERRLGVALVIRSGRSVVLSDAARRLLDGALASERALDAAEADALWIARGGGPRLRILQSIYDDPGWIAALSARLLGWEEPVPVELIRAHPGMLTTTLAEGGADLALSPGGGETPGLRRRHLFEDPLVAVLAPDDPLAMVPGVRAGDLRERRYITYGLLPESGFEYELFFLPGGGMPDSILRVESTSAIVELVAAGQGVSILSRWAVRGAEKTGRVVLRPLLPATPALPWSLLSRKLAGDDPLNALLAEVVGWLPDCFAGSTPTS